MGVDIYVLNFLAATHAVHKRSFGRTLMLGRQGFHIKMQQGRDLAESILRAKDPQASLDAIQPPDEPWADGLFRYLGSTGVSAMDASPYEGADIVHDLNLPVPDLLHGAFDTIFDGGTTEHIFNFPAMLQNVNSMLAVGGLFLSVTAANNLLGHGLYQFSPELMWRAFGPENGFSIEAMYLAPLNGTPSLEDAPDPRIAGRRIEIGMTPARTYLCLAARKVRMHASGFTGHQSDYSRAWNNSSARQITKALGGPRPAPDIPYAMAAESEKSENLMADDTIRITMLQTADPDSYAEILRLTARVNVPYCQHAGIAYESYVGIKRGVAPWMATYNRIFMLNEMLARGAGGWVIFADADAFVADLKYDISTYLLENCQYSLIGRTGGSAAPWNLNAGILFINLDDPLGRAFVADWLARFTASVPDHYLRNPAAKWDEYPNDQDLMYECIKANPDLMQKTKREEGKIFNYRDGAFMKQAIRAGFPDLRSRMNYVRRETDKILGTFAVQASYVDLTGLANKYGSDKGDVVGNKHYYTQFYQFLFEEFRCESFEFMEIGLLRGGPEVGAPASRDGSDVPSVRMWLDYFPNGYCHGIDISDFSAITLERFRFHQGDIGLDVDRARLQAELPSLRLVIDDASHASYHQQVAFAAFWPLVEPGGYYIIEDLDWQPEVYQSTLPQCKLTRDVFLSFTRSRQLDIGFVSEAARTEWASQIDHVSFLRARGNGVVKFVAIQKRGCPRSLA